METNLDMFLSDHNLEKEGIWFQISKEVKFKIRRFGGANTVNVTKANNKYFKPYANLMKTGAIGADEVDSLTLKVFVESCIVDWEGVKIGGELKPYDFNTALQLLTERRDLADILIEYASGSDHYREDLGNS